MAYLLAKIIVLLVLAALLGAWFMRWWLLRQLSEVTSEYRALTGDWAAWRKRVEALLVPVPPPPPAPPTDLRPVLARLDGVEATVTAAVAAIRIPALPEIPAPVAVDLGPLQSRLATLEQAWKSFSVPAPKDVDLSGLVARCEQIEAAVHAIRMPVIPPMPAFPAIPAPIQVDLGPLEARLAELERAWRGFTVPAPRDVDLSGIHVRLEQLDAAVRAIKIPPPAPPPPPRPTVPRPVREGSRNLLLHAAYGRPDDLQLIKGVAKVLEKMMHGIGVYYFWQIAEWTPADVEHADRQLTAFHGRIKRDNWIDQSIVLATRPGSQRRPEGF